MTRSPTRPNAERVDAAPLTREQRALVAAATIVDRLALSLARSSAPMRYDDLVSIGNEELVLAARRFDPSRGTPFESFAYGAVYFGMLKAVGAARREERHRALVAAHLAGLDYLVELRDTPTAADDTDEAALCRLDAHDDGLAASLFAGFVSTRVSEGSEDAVLDRMTRDRAVTVLRQALDGLPGVRPLIEARYVQDREWEDVAAALGCSSATARRQHAAAMQLLGARLRARGVEGAG